MGKRQKRKVRSRARTKAKEAVAVIRQTVSVGRPRSDAERYPCGRLKPPVPSAVMIERRRLLVGNPKAGLLALRAAENPLDLMRARGWLTRGEHDAATTYARLYRAAGVDLPALRTGDLGEASPRRNDNEPVAPRSAANHNPEGDPDAMDRLTACWNTLTRAEMAALMEVCVMETWPRWLQGLTIVLNLAPDLARERARFRSGLAAVADILALPPHAVRRAKAA